MATAPAMAIAQGSGFLGGWNQQQRLNEESTLRNLQALQMQLQIIQQAQQIQQSRQEGAEQVQGQAVAIQEQARTVIADRAKGTCLTNMLGDANAVSAIATMGSSPGKFCGCVESELYSTLTLELTGQILAAVHEYGNNPSQVQETPAGKQYTTRYTSAIASCAGQLVHK